MSTDDVGARAIDRLRREPEIERRIASFKDAGLNKIESIKAIMSWLGCGLGEAKFLVHLSEAWASDLEADDRFHEALAREAERLNDDPGDRRDGTGA